MGGIEVNVDGWGADAVYSGTQKCLSCVPGLSPVTFSSPASETIRARKTRVQSWFLDMSLVMAYWGGNAQRTYHHTAPVNALYALHDSWQLLLATSLVASGITTTPPGGILITDQGRTRTVTQAGTVDIRLEFSAARDCRDGVLTSALENRPFWLESVPKSSGGCPVTLYHR